MNGILARSIQNPRKVSTSFYPSLRTLRAASLNSAIQHGIRRSKGVGFRGKERSQDATPNYERRDGGLRRSEDPPRASFRSQMRSKGSEGRPSTFSPKSRPESTYGKRALASEGKPLGKLRGSERDARSLGKSTARSSFSRGKDKEHPTASGSQEPFPQRQPSGKVVYPSLSRRRSLYESPSQNSFERHQSMDKPRQEIRSPEKVVRSEGNGRSTRSYGRPERNPGSEDDGTAQHVRSHERSSPSGPLRFESTVNRRDESSPSQTRINNRMPISIPYTTPASEFLYGTSVVEAALTSRKVPRRRHYKLYIYNGENREGTSMRRDAGLERLAMKSGVDVERVSGDWLRVMDKMSGGRPHNGYILEASPLPQKPLLSLGGLTSNDGQVGFKVLLDHQSREEAVVNGVDDFIHYSSNVSGRKPLVLLLDSIVDPGNLGGIIRTASFLGVTAIAVSTRNSASFTPVVLKASAGASENVTLFSVNKPAGFLVDSKAAGWKVYAAVAPSGRNNPAGEPTRTTTTDDLRDPLSEHPCILMLGGEGEGLRTNLRSKADFNLSITGNGRSHNVDSLNVSVAAGILCNSFLRRNGIMDVSQTADGKRHEQAKPEVGDMF